MRPRFLAVVLSVSVCLIFSASLAPSSPFFPLLLQCDGCPDVSVWGLMARLRGLLAMGAFYCQGAG